MTNLFLKIVNMGIAAGWLILVVLALRPVLQKAPRWIHVLLWGLVGVRLICPFSIESALSLIPSTETIRPEIMTAAKPSIESGIPAVNQVLNPVIEHTFTPNPSASANPLQIWLPILAAFWCAGVILLLFYGAVSYLRLLRTIRTAVLLRDNIYQSEHIASPFILGVIRPRIYIPFSLTEETLQPVLLHERAHLQRRDHWWKPLGFLLLAVYWFHPLAWLSYILLCRDIELACDEKVIRDLDREERADYSQALLSLSTHRRIAACPLAFGETGVKKRVKSVLSYKRPAFWMIAAAITACIVIVICFLTSPHSDKVFHLEDAAVAFITSPDSEASARLSGAPLERLSAEIMQYTYEKTGNAVPSYYPYQITWHDEQGNIIERLSVLDEQQILYDGSIYRTDEGQLNLTLLAQYYAELVPDGGSDSGSDTALDNAGSDDTNSSDSGIPAFLDLNRNGIAETLVQREMEGGQGQVVEIYENDERLYYAEGGFAHVGWNALFLCTIDGESYLLRYNPTMFQGMSNYSYELFSLKDGHETIAYNEITFDVNFYAPYHEAFDPEGIAAFMEEINGYLAQSTQLLNTDYDLLAAFERTGRLEDDLGILLNSFEPEFSRDPSKSLLENLRLLQQTMEPSASGSLSQRLSSALPFDDMLEMMFCSGAGGWQTMLSLNADGSFTGTYLDSDMGSYDAAKYPNGTEYICQFHGSFKDIVQLSDASWSLTLEELVLDTGHEIGEEWIAADTLRIASTPYGFAAADGSMPKENAQFILYSPEAQGHASGTELYGAIEFQHWHPDRGEYLAAGDTLGCFGLHNIDTGYGFFSLDAWGLD